MTPTVLDVLTASLRKLDVVGAGETPEADEIDVALLAFQLMVDAWEGEGLTMPRQGRNVFNTIGGQTSYTVGPGGDFNVARPSEIKAAATLMLTDPINPFEVPIVGSMTWQEYQMLPFKSLTDTFARRFYYDPTVAGGFGTFYPWPIPTDASNDIVLYLPVPLGTPTGQAEVLALDSGWYEALVYNLSERLLDDFTAPPELGARIINRASQAKAVIERRKARLDTDELGMDRAMTLRSGGGSNELLVNFGITES